MAKNDTVLLDGIIEQRVSDAFPSNRKDEVFEYFGFEQVLKDYDLSREELESGWVDGGDDGGIDGFYTFVNGHLLRDRTTFVWPKRSAEIQVWVLTCKHHDTFRQQPLNSLYASVSELFDLSLEKDGLKGTYSPEILDARALFNTAYSRLSTARATLSIRYAYISRGEAASVAENVQARADQIVQYTQSLFSSSESGFAFVGSADLVAMYRRTKKFSIDLPVVEYLSRGNSGYVVLAELEAYLRFVTDDSHNLRRYLFDSNVRDFLGASRVNEDILETLRDKTAPDFWWLNNGVTMLTTAATVVGKTIRLEDIQIVNGLQTTESIFRHFEQGQDYPFARSLLIKIIVSTEPEHRDRIIRATNNQNIVEAAGLRATDKVQRDIEEYLDNFDWYYERRKNYYRNIGKPANRFVTPMYLAAGLVGIVMKNPAAAVGLRARFMRSDNSYRSIFSDQTPLHVWVKVTEVLKRVEEGLEFVRPEQGAGERFLAFWRNLVSLIVVSKKLASYNYSVDQLLHFNAADITDTDVAEVWGLVAAEMGALYRLKTARKALFVLACCKRAALAFAINDVDVVGRRHPGHSQSHSKGKRRRTNETGSEQRRHVSVSPDLVNRVDAALPQQPWKPGVVRLVADSLKCAPKDVSAAIAQLIEEGRRHRQVAGVVYGTDGQIIAADLDRK